jgi:uncharacterized protein (TIRG00374 family)
MNKKKVVGFLFGISAIGFFLYLVGIREVAQVFFSANPLYLALAAFAVILSLVFRAAVWYGLFALADVTVSFKKILNVYVVSLSAKLAIPVGYLALQTVIAYILSKDSYLTTERVVSVLTLGDVISRLSSYVLGIVAIGLLLFRGRIPATYTSYISVGLAILAFIVSVFLVLWYYRDNLLDITIRIGNFVEKQSNKDNLVGKIIIVEVEDIEQKILNAHESIVLIFSDPKEVFVVFLIAHLGGLSLAGVFLFSGMALGIGFSFTTAVLLAVLSELSGFIPTPGGLGGVESGLIAACILLIDISLVEATTLVLTYRLFSYWMILIGGGGLSSFVPYDIAVSE